MSEHKYVLEPYKGIATRYICPSCGQRDKTFSLYIDTETGEHVNSDVGRCNRESNCGHHYTPKQYFQDNNISLDTPQQQVRWKSKTVLPKKANTSFIPVERFKESLVGYEENSFVKYLSGLFGDETSGQLIARYFIGSSNYKFRNSEFPNYLSEPGASTFWQIDLEGKVRTGKIMLYNAATGKRVKQPFNHIAWTHKGLKVQDFELKQCFFGEHLLRDQTKPVAIVESEKTAIIASVYLPQFIWLAAGSLTNLNAEKCSVLKGRTVVLFPDLNGFDKWTNKAKELSNITTFTVSDLLEQKATEAERQQGLDLADYLIRFDHKEFALPAPIPEAQPQPVQGYPEAHQVVLTKQPPVRPKVKYLESWNQELTDLQEYFQTATLPAAPVPLNACTTILNLQSFIESHLAVARGNNGNKTYLPYLARLEGLKQVLNSL